MAEPRKVPFVTISSFSAPQQQQPTPEPNKKRRREDEAADITLGKDGGGGAAAAVVGSGGSAAMFGNTKGTEGDSGETKPTVRLNLTLSEPNEKGSSEFNYGELVQPRPAQVRGQQVRLFRTPLR